MKFTTLGATHEVFYLEGDHVVRVVLKFGDHEVASWKISGSDTYEYVYGDAVEAREEFVARKLRELFSSGADTR